MTPSVQTPPEVAGARPRSRLVLLQADRASNAQNLDQLRAIKRSHPEVRIVLVRRRVAWWQWDLRETSSLVELVVLQDPVEVDETVRAVLDLARERHLDGVLTVNEECLLAAARVAAELGLAGPSVSAVETCRDKWALSRALVRAGVASPACRTASGVEQALGAARDLGWPVVLKPRDMAASIGVVLARDDAELRAMYPVAAGARWPASTHRQVLVQQLAVGQAIAANAFVERGVFHWVCHSDKRTSPPPFFLTVQDTLADDATAPADLVETTRRAVAAAGIAHGVVHVELVRTAGGLRVIEVTPRMGGGFVAPTVEAHVGVDLLGAAVDLALGRPAPPLSRAPPRAVVGRYVLGRGEGRLGRVTVAEPLPTECIASWSKGSGDAIAQPPRDFFPAVGFVVAVGATVRDATRALDRCMASIEAPVRSRFDPRVAVSLAERLVSRQFRARLRSRLSGRRPATWAPRR